MSYALGFKDGYYHAQADVKVYGTKRWRHGLTCTEWVNEPRTVAGQCVSVECEGYWVMEIALEELRKERIGI